MEKSSQNPSFEQGLELAGIITKAIVNVAKKANADARQVRAIIENPEVIFGLVKKLFAGCGNDKGNSSILRIISGREKLMIGALDDKECIFKAKMVFKSYIDQNFEKCGLNQPSLPTAKIEVDVSEMVEDATFAQIFTGITSDLDKLVLTQAQIIRFCESYEIWLRQEGERYDTFFLMKAEGQYFVVAVEVHSDGLWVVVYNLEYNLTWDGEHRHRVVAPQLMPETE